MSSRLADIIVCVGGGTIGESGHLYIAGDGPVEAVGPGVVGRVSS